MAALPPVLVSAPATTPVSRTEAKAHLRIDAAETGEDTLVDLLIAAATQRLDGVDGILGRALVTQTWRQDFDAWCSRLYLPIGPVASITHIKYDNGGVEQATVDNTTYRLRKDACGEYVEPLPSEAWPTDIETDGTISVTFVAGVAAASVPAPIKAAILLLVGHLYANREEVHVGSAAMQLPVGVDALVGPYRRMYC